MITFKHQYPFKPQAVNAAIHAIAPPVPPESKNFSVNDLPDVFFSLKVDPARHFCLPSICKGKTIFIVQWAQTSPHVFQHFT